MSRLGDYRSEWIRKHSFRGERIARKVRRGLSNGRDREKIERKSRESGGRAPRNFMIFVLRSRLRGSVADSAESWFAYPRLGKKAFRGKTRSYGKLRGTRGRSFFRRRIPTSLDELIPLVSVQPDVRNRRSSSAQRYLFSGCTFVPAQPFYGSIRNRERKRDRFPWEYNWI